MNHDLYDTPADIAREKEEKDFQDKVKLVHNRLLQAKSSLFTVAELRFLLNIPERIHQYAVPKYDKDDFEKLQKLEQKVLHRNKKDKNPA